MQPGTRLYYVDFLRVGAFAILIFYHSSVAFFPDMPWLMKSTEGSAALSLLMKFPRAWRLALLFFVSGMGTWFAFRGKADLSFLKERFKRLFLPLLFASCVIVVPQVWYERVAEDDYQGSLLTFWITQYFTEGKYPTGNFTWAHMWFVAYLLVMTVICYPAFRLSAHPRAQGLTAWFERIARSHAIYLFFVLPLVLNLALSPFYPRETNALYNDGAWFAVWASWFGLGFLVAKSHEQVIGAIIEKRFVSATLCAALCAFLCAYSWTKIGGYFIGDYEHLTPLFKALLFALAWSTILTCVGFCALHFNCKSATVEWLNRKIFSLYIVHQTVVVAALYYVLPLRTGVWTKYTAVVGATAFGSMAFAMLAETFPAPLQRLVGFQDRSTPAATRSAEPAHMGSSVSDT